MPKLGKVRLQKKTTLENFTGFLRQLDAECPNHDAVIVSGHACTHWILKYADRAWPGETVRAVSGKDLDLLVAPRVVGKHFLDEDVYEPSYVYIRDMLFMLARRFFLRQAITPWAPHFIVRCGQIRVWSSKGKGAVYVDFFAHPFGWLPSHARKWAVPEVIDEVECQIMNPVHCLWNFILAAAVLDQRKGDRAKRLRKDHRRVLRLMPVVKEYLIDLQNGVYPDSPRLLKGAIEDMKRIRKNRLTEKIEKELEIALEDALPEGISLS